MKLNDEEAKLLANPSGSCMLKEDAAYIMYRKNNWEDVKEFCSPFSIEKSKINTDEGRAVIDLPTGNETFEYGMLLVRLGGKRVFVFTPGDFIDIFLLKVS